MKTTTIKSDLNGIDAAAQAATIDAIRQQPALGNVRFSATTQWTGGTRTTTEATSFEAGGSTHQRAKPHKTFSDMPQPFLGTDEAPAPTEIALHALGSCLTSTLVYHCTVRGFTVRSVSTQIEASLDACGFLRLDDNTDSGFTDVRVSLKADTDAPESELQDIIKHSPVLDVFTRAIPVRATARSTA